MGTDARRAFGPPAVRRWIESAPALNTAPVHFVARARENAPRDRMARRLGGASHRLGSGHITPRRVVQRIRGCSLATRFPSVGYGR
jgi:hypothetical protein